MAYIYSVEVLLFLSIFQYIHRDGDKVLCFEHVSKHLLNLNLNPLYSNRLEDTCCKILCHTFLMQILWEINFYNSMLLNDFKHVRNAEFNIQSLSCMVDLRIVLKLEVQRSIRK